MAPLKRPADIPMPIETWRRSLAQLPPTVMRFDPTACAIAGIVERADRLIESRGDLLGEPLGFVRPRQDNEVVAADMSNEALVSAGDPGEQVGQHRDHPVASSEPVVIVELLEAVDVHVEQGEVAAPRGGRRYSSVIVGCRGPDSGFNARAHSTVAPQRQRGRGARPRHMAW